MVQNDRYLKEWQKFKYKFLAFLNTKGSCPAEAAPDGEELDFLDKIKGWGNSYGQMTCMTPYSNTNEATHTPPTITLEPLVNQAI